MNATISTHPEAKSGGAQIDPRRLRERVRELPALPQAVTDVLAVLRSEDASAEACARLIARDQSMAARTLKLANSAFYGVPGRVATIRDAVNLLGRRTLASLLTTAAVSAQFAPSACPGFDFGQFWRHAIATAIGAKALARSLALDDDEAFVAGLLHDIGRLALASHFPAEMAAALAHGRADDLPPWQAERAVLGLDHCQVGALIGAHWRFPAHVVAAITLHHAPAHPDDAGPGPTLTDVVHLADAVAHALDLGGVDDEAVPELDTGAWTRARLEPPAWLSLFAHTESGVKALCATLGV